MGGLLTERNDLWLMCTVITILRNHKTVNLAITEGQNGFYGGQPFYFIKQLILIGITPYTPRYLFPNLI